MPPPPTNGLPDAACNMRGSGRVKKKKVYPTTRGSLIAPPPPHTKKIVRLDFSFTKCVRLIALFESGLSYVNKVNYLQLICCKHAKCSADLPR